MFEALDDPYSSYMTSRGVPGQPGAASRASSRASAPRWPAEDAQRRGLRPARADMCRCVVVGSSADSPAETAGLLAGDVVVAVDGATGGGHDARRRGRDGQGPQGHRGDALAPARRHGRGADHHPRRHRDRGRHAPSCWRTARSATCESAASAPARRTTSSSAAQGAARRRHPPLRRRPARRSGRLRGRGAQSIASQFVGLRADLLGGVRGRAADAARGASGDGLATDPAHQGRRARERRLGIARARSWRARSTTRAAPRWSARRPSARAPSSSGTCCRNDSGGFRLSVAKWLTPDKRWIHGVGITPDVVVPVPDGTPADQDPQLDRALELLAANPARPPGRRPSTPGRDSPRPARSPASRAPRHPAGIVGLPLRRLT